MRRERIQIPLSLKRAIIGPPAKRRFARWPMVAQLGTCSLVALWFFRGSGPILLRNPIALWFSLGVGGGGVRTPCIPLDPRWPRICEINLYFSRNWSDRIPISMHGVTLVCSEIGTLIKEKMEKGETPVQKKTFVVTEFRPRTVTKMSLQSIV